MSKELFIRGKKYVDLEEYLEYTKQKNILEVDQADIIYDFNLLAKELFFNFQLRGQIPQYFKYKDDLEKVMVYLYRVFLENETQEVKTKKVENTDDLL